MCICRKLLAYYPYAAAVCDSEYVLMAMVATIMCALQNILAYIHPDDHSAVTDFAESMREREGDIGRGHS